MRIREKFLRINSSELERRGYNVLFVLVNNQRIFLIDKNKDFSKIGKRFSLTREETHKNSVAKQAMAMQLGRIIGSTRKELRTYTATVLPMPKAGAYPAWEVF